MKTLIKKYGLILISVGFAVSALSCGKDDNPPEASFGSGDISSLAIRSVIDSFPKEPLSIAEKNSLILMREEEKMARDVYTILYAKWGSKPFYNISSSEQTHMDAILTLLNKYEIKDPVGSNPVGVFENVALQKLYNLLVSQGNKSSLDAFKAGASIEDLDIFDLKRLSTDVDNKDILFVYGNLERGSRNHMRAFNRNILNLGSSYVPQFISLAEYDGIINSSMESGNW